MKKAISHWLACKLVSFLKANGYTVLSTPEAVDIDADLLGVREHMIDISERLREEMLDMDNRIDSFESVVGPDLEDMSDDSYFLEVN